MKKLTLLLLLMIIAVGCGDDIESNSPSIQGEVNGEFFRTNASSAYLNQDGSITLTGETGLDQIILKAAQFEIGSYELGNGSQSEAAYEVNGIGVYSTGITGDGAIEITRTTSTTLSGEFYFNAYLNGNGDTLNVSKGSFFDVPITNVSGGEGLSCSQAQQATAVAQIAYEDADPESGEFSDICNAFKAALEMQIEVCGDTSGMLQVQLDSLPCSENEGEEEAEAYLNATINGDAFVSEITASSVYGNSQSYSIQYENQSTCVDYNYMPGLYPYDDESLPHMSVGFIRFLEEAGVSCNQETTNFDNLIDTGSYAYSTGEDDYGVYVSYAENDEYYTSYGAQNPDASFQVTSVSSLNCAPKACLLIEGAFSCTLYNQQDSSDTIEVTNGEFKIVMESYNNF